ncbi:glycosyltransferase family 4 protein, partial [bacterium]|nr:glycosyltransferase family 4 protein [bacterium]
CTFISGSELKKNGPVGALGLVRKIHRESGGGIFAIYSFDWDHQSRHTALYTLACMVPARRRVAIDTKGVTYPLTWTGLVVNELPSAFSQAIAGRQLVRNVNNRVTEGIKGFTTMRHVAKGSVRRILYLKTDLWFGVKAGGSIGHVAGVINAFLKRGLNIDIIAPEKPLLLDGAARSIIIRPDNFYRNIHEMSLLYYNELVLDIGMKALRENPPDAVYARYALDSFVPVTISNKLGVPLILEYNGSEVWIKKHWGTSLKLPGIAKKIEDYVLQSADMITVVSLPLKDELLERGIDENRILVNPNAVNPDTFDPDRFSDDEINNLKSSLGIPGGTLVAGFIGTFSPWHGVEVLAKAIPLALKNNSRLHFLLIGGGPLINRVKDQLRISDVLKRVTFTGLIPQDEAPKYLMCSDFFLSPHVPNPDGTPFFGSPTKLFEYMALGKGIVASDLDQLGEILEHEITALLVKPGNAQELATAIGRLCDNMELRAKLGEAARREAIGNHTWDAHVGRILDHLYSLK